MKISKEKQDQILSAIGVQLSLTSISYDESNIKRYVSQDYKNSERFQSDEIYHMFEISLLHQRSGLRIVYTTTESYFGDSDEYKLISLFIITRSQQQIEITDVDFSKKLFFAANEIIPFGDVDAQSMK